MKKKKQGYMHTYLLAPPAPYASKIGLGSVGLDILCFLPELVLVLGSAATGEVFEPEGVLVNHLWGLLKNCVKLDDGDVERGKPKKAGDDGLELVKLS